MPFSKKPLKKKTQKTKEQQKKNRVKGTSGRVGGVGEAGGREKVLSIF
jgi:hypothetical protein